MDEKELKKQETKKSLEEDESHQKTVLLTTDGKDVEIKYENVSFLEIEMMLTKALQYLRFKKV